MRLEPLNITIGGAVPISAAAVCGHQWPRQADLLAILDAGPIGIDDLDFMSRHRQAKALLSIESLIAALDALEADPDLEDTGDDELTGDEAEPTLGAPEVEFTYRGIPNRAGHINQSRWADGIGRAEEDEPSLGSTDARYARWYDRDGWSAGYQRKLHLDECEDVSEDEGACIQSQPHDGDDIADDCSVEDNVTITPGELSLGWSEGVDQSDLGQPSQDGDATVPERYGKGFVQCVGDDDDTEQNGDELDGPGDDGIADFDGLAEQWGGRVGRGDYVE